MKSNVFILALPALAAAAQAPVPAAAAMANLVARQQVTTTTAAASASVTQDSQSACASSYTSLWNELLTASGAPPYPSAVDDWYEEKRRTVTTTDYICAIYISGLPDALSSIEVAWQSSMESFLYNNSKIQLATVPPPQCSQVWSSVIAEPGETARSQLSSCMSGAKAARSTATRFTNATSSATSTPSSSAAAPANTGAAGRNGVSAGLAVGAAAMVGYLGMA
ncbi:hypothetical protein PspLS_00179 [Pyricularia sp. CBS 133598]|nr:hypothetical protein PspLS_00179 [Pyricularia sp. CBS 133598]